MSEEGREKIRESNRRRWADPVERERQTELRKQRKHTSDEKEKISKALTGRIHSEETKEKIRNSNIGKHPYLNDVRPQMTREIAMKIGASNTGKVRTKESRIQGGNNRRGKRNGSYKHGNTSLYHLIRYCPEMEEWRMSVFERDNFTDWYSGVIGNGNLHAHHIISFSFLLQKYNITTLDEARACKELWDITNGVTMLNGTHMAHHSMWGNYNPQTLLPIPSHTQSPA